MAMEKIGMNKLREVLRLKYEHGIGNRQIAISCRTTHRMDFSNPLKAIDKTTAIFFKKIHKIKKVLDKIIYLWYDNRKIII